MSELRSFSLEAALIGAVALRQAGRILQARPALPPLPALPALPHFPSFRPRPSGLWVPASPAIVASSTAPAAESGTAAGRARLFSVGAEPSRPGMARSWSSAVDLDGLVAFLRSRHPTKTAAHVAALTGEPLETVRKWLRHETRPGMRAMLILVCVYELPLVEACLNRHPDWIRRARADAGRHALAAELRTLWPRIEAMMESAR